MLVRPVLLLTAIVLPWQLGSKEPPSPKKLPPIQSERLARDIHDKNVGDILNVLTPKSELVTPEGKTVRGEQDIRQSYEQMSSRFDTELHLQMTSFGQTGTFGIEHGNFTETQRDRTTGQAKQIHGTYVFLHERQENGEWHIARQKWDATR